MPNETIFLRMPPSEKARFQQWINGLEKDTNDEVKRVMAETIETAARRAKMFAPVDKGLLRGSIRTTKSPDGLGGTVYTGRLYAPYQEFGTGSKVKVSDDLRDYAMTFKGKGIRKVNISAQPYLFPAVRLSIKEMERKLEKLGFKKK